jgi:hypothetical protein
MLKPAIISAALALVGCTPTFTQTGSAAKPLGPDCTFQVLTVSPSAPFTELGVVEHLAPDSYPYQDLPALKAQIRPFVCKAGGNAAIAHMDTEKRYYDRATIIRVEEPGATGATAGCQYDTQCKGDRICVAGRCTDPPRSP